MTIPKDSLRANEMESPISVLIVDDEVDYIQPLCKRLQRRGFNVDYATSGRMALNEMSIKLFDLVIVDFLMPDMNGEELFEAIRNEQPDIPVIMVTGHAQFKHAFKLGRKGISDYLAKPVDIEVMVASIRKACQGK